MTGCSCCAGIHKTKLCKGALFVLLVVLNCADFIADWLLYASVSRLESGLVYGPIASSLKLALLIFAIIGSILFPLEIFNAALKTFRDKCFVQADVMSAFVLWLTDVPQITINVIIAACREELLSEFQIAKGAVVISGCAIRLLAVIIRYCSKKHLKEIQMTSPKTRCRVAARFLVVIGIKLTCIGSILVFIFSLFHVQDGELRPYNSNRHFENVGIFVDPNAVYPGGKLNRSAFIKVCSMQEVMATDSYFSVRYRFEAETDSPRVTIAKQIGSESFQVIQCFKLSLSPELNVTSQLPVSSCGDITTANAHSTTLRFLFKMPVHSFWTKHIFGEIYFNGIRNFTNNSIPFFIHIKSSAANGGPVGYFRYQPLISGQQDFIFPQHSLLGIREVWKTGYLMCDSSGSLSPVWDSSLPIADI